jgi:hypothetical protein
MVTPSLSKSLGGNCHMLNDGEVVADEQVGEPEIAPQLGGAASSVN